MKVRDTTFQEKEMSVEELEKVIENLGKETEDLMGKIADKTCKVRAQPYGQDRFHRFYWVLPHHGGVFLESVESGGINNPGCTVQLSSIPEPEVRSCVQSLMDKVCMSNEDHPVLDLSGRQKPSKVGRVLPEEMQTGWWQVKTKEELDRLTKSFHERGIRERALHRNLHRYSVYVGRRSFLNSRPSKGLCTM